MNDTHKAHRDAAVARIEAALSEALSTLTLTGQENCAQERVLDAMRYSVAAGGKRIRPLLTLEFCRLCGGGEDAAMAPAVAIELLHTFSLIHDDLPCMDDDDLRRGRPSCHKAFDEATALLAGDGLIPAAFEHITRAVQSGVLSAQAAVALVGSIARAIGVGGMTGGQVLDMRAEGRDITAEELLELDRLKTGSLIKAACTAGCIAAGADERLTGLAAEYGENIGLAFQIIDDILDVTGDVRILGKPVGSDEKHKKTTYVTLYGIDAATAHAAALTERALDILSEFPGSDFLAALTEELCTRRY